MGWVWRALIAALLLGSTVAVVPGIETYASSGLQADGSDVLSPASNDDCPNSNPRKQKKCHYNNQDNIDDNVSGAMDVSTTQSGNGVVWSSDSIGSSVSNGELTVDLGRSADKPVFNVPFQITVTGNGAPISYIEYWVDSPNPAGDDIGALGRQHQDCGGAQPCTLAQTVVARNNGWYQLHAMVVDTSGRVAGTNWQFLASENARN
jgi:hypothetical protein